MATDEDDTKKWFEGLFGTGEKVTTTNDPLFETGEKRANDPPSGTRSTGYNYEVSSIDSPFPSEYQERRIIPFSDVPAQSSEQINTELNTEDRQGDLVACISSSKSSNKEDLVAYISSSSSNSSKSSRTSGPGARDPDGSWYNNNNNNNNNNECLDSFHSSMDVSSRGYQDPDGSTLYGQVETVYTSDPSAIERIKQECDARMCAVDEVLGEIQANEESTDSISKISNVSDPSYFMHPMKQEDERTPIVDNLLPIKQESIKKRDHLNWQDLIEDMDLVQEFCSFDKNVRETIDERIRALWNFSHCKESDVARYGTRLIKEQLSNQQSVQKDNEVVPEEVPSSQPAKSNVPLKQLQPTSHLTFERRIEILQGRILEAKTEGELIRIQTEIQMVKAEKEILGDSIKGSASAHLKHGDKDWALAQLSKINAEQFSVSIPDKIDEDSAGR